MTVVRFEPWSLINRLHGELDQLLGAPPSAGSRAASRVAALIPHVDVREAADRYLLQADLPGVQPTDIEITADQGVLTIREPRGVERREDAETPARVERFAGIFQRRFTLPDNANAEAISARSHHGVLELTIMKQVKPEPRRISVEAA